MFTTITIDPDEEFKDVQQNVEHLTKQHARIKVNLDQNQCAFIKGKYYYLNK